MRIKPRCGAILFGLAAGMTATAAAAEAAVTTSTAGAAPSAAPASSLAGGSGTAGSDLTDKDKAAIAKAKELVFVPTGAVELTEAMLAANARLPVPRTIGVNEFAARPRFTEPRLSPDGLRFAARLLADGKEMLGIFHLDGREKPRVWSIPDDFDMDDYYWAGNDRVLLSVGKVVPWMDDEARSTRTISIEAATGKMAVLGRPKEMGLRGDDVLWVDPDGKTLLLAFQPTIYDWPAVFSVDLATNKLTKVVPAMTGIWNWYADTGGVVRYGYGWPDSHHWQMVYRKDATQPLKVVARGTDKDDETADIAKDKAFSIAAGSDEGFRYGVNALSGFTGVYRYNFATHERGQTVFEAPGSDVDLAYLTDDGKAMLSAFYTDSKDRVKWFDPRLEELQQAFEASVSGAMGEREVWIASRNRDNTIMIVNILGSNDPGRHYVYQEATGRLSPLSTASVTLKPTDLAITRYVYYTARDGEEIPAYLTLPPGRAAKGLPLVVMPHGGPYGIRDRGDYDSDVQFLVNRGYAVLQPQYRGSGSYGQRFDENGGGQWGRAMQDDIDDGMDWLAKRGIVDPTRVCIVGSSYGGYAAVWGATRNPERYRCAASFAGISDLGRQLKYQMNSMDDRQEKDRWRKKVQGDETFDMKSVSALYNVARLKVPVMLVHGTKDQRVPVKQSRLYVDALKAAGRPYEYYELEGEGHGFFKETSARTWYERLDAFLARYNPAK